MRGDLHVAALRDEVGGVKAFVAAYRHSLRAGKLFQHHQRGVALGRPAGFPHHGVHDQSEKIRTGEQLYMAGGVPVTIP
jgi:hypothetical protein